MENNKVNVTKTYLPEINEYFDKIRIPWKNEWITNRGELVNELENSLKDYLGVRGMILMSNGTIPIQIALRLLGNNSEIITTPFSYIATSSSIIWENCKPIFVDISNEYLTIDESKIEQSITPNTTCILATHVFGNPCNVDEITRIAKKYNLNVIYDAAHCFGVKYKGESIFNYGDISTCSFHATKIFHTVEGGALFCNDELLRDKCFYSHNFGHNGPDKFAGVGINGKMSEMHAAMGLVVLPHMNEIIEARVKIVNCYDNMIDFNRVERIKIREYTDWNYSYYPIIFKSEGDLLKTLLKLNELNIFPRRYFYPSLNTIDYLNGPSMPISESISSRILCLPLSHDLSQSVIFNIISVLNNG
jgi:dTDP-4-amino-4,6-dideoxygalactose transaminase